MRRTLSEIANDLDTDKTESQGYIENYDRHFGHLRSKPVRLLELGVLHGGSLLMWQEYFPEGLVVGLDLNPNPFSEMPERVRFYRGSQDNETLTLQRIISAWSVSSRSSLMRWHGQILRFPTEATVACRAALR